MPPRLELAGKQFGRLTVIERSHKDRFSNWMWLCRCECGTQLTVRGAILVAGRAESCASCASRVSLTPEERTLRAKMAAHSRWAKTDDRAKETADARDAFELRFLREVDPENKLSPAEREKRAENARKAYFARLALKSAVARRKRSTSGEPGPLRSVDD